jgi:hypothetical protein
MALGQGVMAIAYGPAPTWIGAPGVLVAIAIGVTVPPRPFDTYTVGVTPATTRPVTGDAAARLCASPDISPPTAGASSDPGWVALQGGPGPGDEGNLRCWHFVTFFPYSQRPRAGSA